MKRALIILATILGGFALLLGIFEGGRQLQWWGEPDELRAIKREKVVDGRLLGLELIERRENGKNSLLTKTGSPSTMLVFKTSDPLATRNKIVQFAENDGWKHIDDPMSYGEWRARKSIHDMMLTLTIRTESSKISVGVTSYVK